MERYGLTDPARRGAVDAIMVALLLSGVAGIANQVLWQRALKIFLGGSETFSSMIVVLVFMLGLGVGAGWVGARCARLRHPLAALAGVELALFAVNGFLAWLLGLDVSESVYAIERLAVSAGVPIRLVYALASFAVLLAPTLLMGATMPLASEACQRQFGATQSSLIAVLFFVNTLGAVVGAFGSSFYSLPWFGQQSSLLAAASFNLFAAAVAGGLAWRTAAVAAGAGSGEGSLLAALFRPLRLEELLGAILGFLSLGFEMYLLRLMSLAHEPLPHTFAVTLCLYLLYWSLGVFLSSRFRERLTLTLVLCAASVLATPLLYDYDRWQAGFSMWVGAQLYFLPCLFFGFLYGALVSRSARDWGSDVGRFYALNTVGSCCGILFFPWWATSSSTGSTPS